MPDWALKVLEDDPPPAENVAEFVTTTLYQRLACTLGAIDQAAKLQTTERPPFVTDEHISSLHGAIAQWAALDNDLDRARWTLMIMACFGNSEEVLLLDEPWAGPQPTYLLAGDCVVLPGAAAVRLRFRGYHIEHCPADEFAVYSPPVTSWLDQPITPFVGGLLLDL